MANLFRRFFRRVPARQSVVAATGKIAIFIDFEETKTEMKFHTFAFYGG